MQRFYDDSALNASAANAVSGGTQWFNDNSALNASAANAVSGGVQWLYDASQLNAGAANAVSDGSQFFNESSALNASASDAVSGGDQVFNENSALNASAANAVSGGLQSFSVSSALNASATDAVSGGQQRFYDNSALNASAVGAVSGGAQDFHGFSALNASAANAVSGGTQWFNDASALNASAANAVSGGLQRFDNNSVFNASAVGAIRGGNQTFVSNSALNASVANAVSGGGQAFFETSTLNASVTNAVSEGDQVFYHSSVLNASAVRAISGGNQTFVGNSTLNASAENAISGGNQTFVGNSTLNASVENAVSGGELRFDDSSSLTASAANAVSDGRQWFDDSSAFNASATNAASGGTQIFRSNSRLNASVAEAVSGGVQIFDNTSVLDASAAKAVSGGEQWLYDNSALNASVAEAVSGGVQIFDDTSTLDASAQNAVSGGAQEFFRDSTLNVLADNALTTATDILFNNFDGGPGGRLRLNGYSTAVGRISSAISGSGVITNGAAGDSILTIDTSRIGPGPRIFSGRIENGGTGTLGLIMAGGEWTMAGTATHTGGTIVSRGTLLVGDADGNGTLGGVVTVGSNGTLGGSGTLTGAVTVDGMLSAGSSPGTLTFTDNLTLNAGSTSAFELNTPGVVGGTGADGNDLVRVGGTLSLDGTLEARVAAAGYYRLFEYGSLAAGSEFATEQVSSSNSGFTVASHEVQYSTFGQVNLSVLGTGQSMQFWDGVDATGNSSVDGGGGVWQGFATNWTDSTGDANSGWGGSVGVFAGAAGGAVTVHGTQSFDTLQFSTNGYTLTGGTLQLDPAGGTAGTLNIDNGISTTVDAVIADGTGNSLKKTGGGTLTLTGANTYSGGTQLLGGVLSVSDDASLGAASGGLFFDGGALRVDGTGFTGTDRAITLDTNGGGLDIADAANTFTLDQDIAGTGDLVKRGAGTLVLSGDNAYGNTFVAAGQLVGDTGSISGDIANAGTITFDQAGDASFGGDIADLDGTDGAMVKQGAGMLSLGGVSILDWTIAEGGLETAAARFGGDVELDGATTAFSFTDSDDATYGGEFSGNGLFSLDGDGTVLLTGDSSGFTGSTMLNAGTLLVGDADGNGSLGGSLDVLDGATLGGAGTVGSGAGSLVTVASGGTLAPGNSIGTLTVDGDLAFEAGSRFAVEVNPQGNESDLVEVTGNATLNGATVAHVGATGEYDLRSTYTILSADGTLSGEFEDVTSDFAFLTPELIYDPGAGTVGLELSRNDRDFGSAALTHNQKATAEGIDSIGLAAGHAVYDAIAQLADDDDLIRASFDQLSGEIYASAQTALIEDSRFIRNAANDRIRTAFGDAGASVAPVLAYGPGDTPMAVAADHAGPVFWSQGFGSWGSTGSDGNAAALNRSTGGLLFGTDGLVGDWRVGLLAGYSQSSFDADDHTSSGDSDNYHLGLYGGTEWGDMAFRTGAAYTWHDIETNRSVSIPGLTDSLSADYSAGTFQAFGELGYGFDLATNSRLEPFANLAHVSLSTGGFTEDGGAAALSVDGDTTNVTFTTLGLRAEHGVALGTVNATLTGMVGWRHAFGDVTPESTHAFSAGDAFTVAGVPIAEDAAVIEAGLDLNLTPDATLGLSYQGQIASDAQEHGFKANLSVRF